MLQIIVTFHHNFTSIENLIFFQQNMFASLLNKKNFFFSERESWSRKVKTHFKARRNECHCKLADSTWTNAAPWAGLPRTGGTLQEDNWENCCYLTSLIHLLFKWNDWAKTEGSVIHHYSCFIAFFQQKLTCNQTLFDSFSYMFWWNNNFIFF